MQLPIRPRRLRATETIRSLVAETRLAAQDFIYPLFVHAQARDEDVESMPGICRRSVNSLLKECESATAAGLRAVAIFPCIDPALKNPDGSAAFNGFLSGVISEVKATVPELMVVADVALDPFTDHGHDGLVSSAGEVLNDQTIEVLCRLAVMEADAGADCVAPSDMMDGRVAAIRSALDAAGHERTLIMSYAAKYASAYYGPFREAVGSKVGAISKAGYQMNPANVREALREVALDVQEGADIVMVKPAGAYLDVIRAVKESTTLPVAAYQVSGEYSQIHAAARLGWLDYHRTRNESLIAIRRAGADLILTYFAKEMAEAMQCAD